MAIYLDNSATTRVRQEVIDAMLPYLGENWGNPSSIHAHGRQTKKAVDNARRQVAELLNCDAEEVYFSPCGTLSNNVALLGRARFSEANGSGRHLITSLIEHPSVMGPAKYLETCGWKVTYLPFDREGIVSIDAVKSATTADTSIISLMWVNNEIGTVQPIEEIANFAREREIFFHTDAVQVPGKIAIDLADSGISSLSLSGHKFNAPKGIGILFVRRLCNLMPIVFGGGQEMGLMPGTEGIANIVAIGMAAEIARRELEQNRRRLFEIQRIILDSLSSIIGIRVTGPADIEKRLPGHISLVVPGAEGEALVMRADMKGLAVSSGSACHKGIIEPSAVLKAIGLSNDEAMGSLRISAGALTSIEDARKGAEVLVSVVKSMVRDSSEMPARK